MKIITLLPVKNEEWVLPFSLKNFESFSDEIILLDDGSTDHTKETALLHPKVTVIPCPYQEKPVDMSKRRSLLLEEGRKRNGTHFIMLDADEIFSEKTFHILPEILKNMKPGETLLFPWLFVHAQENRFVYDRRQEKNLKDFVFCDDKKSIYSQKKLSEDRTPGNRKLMREVPFEKGCVFHLQNISRKRNKYKQAWYRCNELLEGKKGVKRINAVYGFTKDVHILNPAAVHDTFLEENKNLLNTETGHEWYLDEIRDMFKSKGVTFFEGLDIWNISALENAFIAETGKKPKPEFYPNWILLANKLKNYLKRKLL